MNRFVGLCEFAMLAMVAHAGTGTDWSTLNETARQEALTEIRPGEPGKMPFWNAHAKAFIHPPSFEFREILGAERYRFTVTELTDGKRHEFDAEKPWASLKSVWNEIRPGYVLVVVDAVDARDCPCGVSGTRYFYRAARFNGPYPSSNGDYAEAAHRCFESIYRLPYVQGWLAQNVPPDGYDLYCYPSKILSSMVSALVRYSATASAEDAEKAVAISCKMADWLIAQSQPKGAPLEYLPPTYWGDRRSTAVAYRGQNMMIYPVFAGNAYFLLAEKTGEGKYREAALRIAETLRRLQNDQGTWWLKIFEKDGRPVRENLLVPGLEFFDFFETAAKVSGDAGYRMVAARAGSFVEKGTFASWNWDGQFEDIDPLPPYVDLTPARAFGFSSWLFRAGRTADAKLTLAWCEDQFVVWSDPIHHMDWKNWKMPTVLEQYEYYTPIDNSMGNMVKALIVAWKWTGEDLYREKARALADCLLRHQRSDGTIPTYFDKRGGSDWINCMVCSAESLMAFAEIARGQD